MDKKQIEALQSIIEEQDEYNIDIHREDEVMVIKEDEEYSIILNDGGNYE